MTARGLQSSVSSSQSNGASGLSDLLIADNCQHPPSLLSLNTENRQLTTDNFAPRSSSSLFVPFEPFRGQETRSRPGRAAGAQPEGPGGEPDTPTSARSIPNSQLAIPASAVIFYPSPLRPVWLRAKS